jgi:hypothetical protein
MLKNKRVKIYIVVFEANINSFNMYHKGAHMIVIKQLVWGGGGGGAKPFFDKKSSNNFVKLLDLKWAN